MVNPPSPIDVQSPGQPPADARHPTGDAHRQALEAAIAALQAQRAVLGEDLVDAALRPLRDRLAAGQPAAPPAAPAAPAPPARRLRQVSVLFLDIVGSTRLIEDLDPEDVQSVVDGALAAFTGIVVRHGGEVLRYAGDSLKAAFGAQVTREDDAERAVLCGLALLQEAARQAERAQRQFGRDVLEARVGIHSGPVVRGGGVEQENSLSGLAVYIAARMEQTAPPGALRISMDTYRLVQGRFEVLEQPALQVKGLHEALRTFLVQGERERRLRGLRHGADGVTTAMFGRDAELGRLQALTRTVFAPGGRLAAATVAGDAGLGKSRLLAEVQAALPAQVKAGAVWRASSHPQGLYQPYGLLRDLLFWHLDVRDSASQAEAQETFAAALRPVFGAAAAEQTALLGQLIGLDYSASPFIAGILQDGKQLQARGLNAWVRFLQQQSAVHPLLLVLDDLQWADDESLDALEQLVAAAPGVPVFLLCAARPELLQRRPQWGAQWPAHELIQLSPLPAEGSEALAAALLARFEAPVPALQALLSAHSAGNPYYLEALLQMLVDTGVIQTAGERWQLRAGGLEGIQVPPTLVGVLQATLDALEAQERRSLQQASVVGAVFWDEALSAIDPLATDQLQRLSQRELTLPQAQSAFDGTREFSFRHQLLHQVTYGTVLKADKREAHGRAAHWLEGRSHGRGNELAGQIAEHFERAGDIEAAIGHWLRAAEDASRRQANAAALAHADRALALDTGADPSRQVRLHRVRGDVFRRIGDSARHAQAVETLESLADRTNDDVLRLNLAHDRVWLLFSEGRFAEAVELAERRLAAAEARAPRDAARVHGLSFLCLTRMGRHEEALGHAQQGLAQARAVGDPSVAAAIHTNMGVSHMEAYRLGPALASYQQALEAYQAAGSRMGIANVRLNLAVIDSMLGRFVQAREQSLQVVAECQDIGARRLEAMARANLGGVLCELGEPGQGYDSAMAGLSLARLSRESRTEAWAHSSAQVAASGLGRLADALEHARAACAGFRVHNDKASEWIHASAAVQYLQGLGRDQEALAAADALLAEVQERGGWDGAHEPPYHLHCALAPLGDTRAEALLAEAYRALNARAELLAAYVPRDTFLRSTAAGRSICERWGQSAGNRQPEAPGGG